MKRLSRSIVAVLALLAASLPAVYAAERSRAGEFPNKPIRWVIPFPPGGSIDMVGRFLGARLTERLGTQMVIDNPAARPASSAPKWLPTRLRTATPCS